MTGLSNVTGFTTPTNANGYTTSTTIMLKGDPDVPPAPKKPTKNDDCNRRVVDCARKLIFQESSSNFNSTPPIGTPTPFSKNSESDFSAPVTNLSTELIFHEPSVEKKQTKQSAEDLEVIEILSSLSSRPSSLKSAGFRAIEPMLLCAKPLVRPIPSPIDSIPSFNKSPLPKKTKILRDKITVKLSSTEKGPKS